jgi:hypothetical protein
MRNFCTCTRLQMLLNGEVFENGRGKIWSTHDRKEYSFFFFRKNLREEDLFVDWKVPKVS